MRSSKGNGREAPGAAGSKRQLKEEHKQFVRFVNIRARGFWTIGRAEDGRLFVCGLNNFGQLAVPPQSSPTHRKSAAGTSDQDDGGIGPPKPKSPATIAAGQEESNKVALLTCATAFPADKRWTHVAGVQHVICRSGDDSQIYGIGKNTDNALGLDTWLCSDVWMDILPSFDHAQLGLKMALLSDRFDALVDTHFDEAEPPKAKVSVPIGANFVQQSPWEPMDGNFVDFPLPDLPLPNKLRIRFMIEYIDHSVIASLRANKQVWYTKGTTVYYCVDSDDTESDAHQQQEHQQNWNVLAREIWPIFSANMRNLMFNNEHHLDQLCRRISPSCLTDLDKLDWIYSGRLFPDVIAADGSNECAARQVLYKNFPVPPLRSVTPSIQFVLVKMRIWPFVLDNKRTNERDADADQGAGSWCSTR
ncbi:hypothetical protein niasHT_004930 [Heterodera trifolii]|uniref:Uncharacterized protein n=1 Tax=Heterodera trifolii TaxID=157864 RepID=A0ABD2M8R0_9BILA